jgi:hypothetical protein
VCGLLGVVRGRGPVRRGSDMSMSVSSHEPTLIREQDTSQPTKCAGR